MKQWATNFIFCVMTLVLLGYITPDGKFEKQIKLAVSVLFVAAIFMPAMQLLKSGNFNDSLFQTTLGLDRAAMTRQENALDNVYEKQIVNAYKTDLRNAIYKKLQSKTGFDGQIELAIDEDLASSSFGEIISINVLQSNVKSSQIKKIIYEFYSVEGENIFITESEGNS